MAQIIEHTIHYTPSGMMIGRYPWELLEEPGDMVVVTGEFLQVRDLQVSSCDYGKRHDIKISTRKDGPHKVYCLRER